MFDVDFLIGADISASSTDGNTANSAVGVGSYNSPQATWLWQAMRAIATVGLQITATAFVATLQFETSIDGIAWVPILGVPVGGGTPVSSTTVAGKWLFPVSGTPYFRVRCSAFTSQTGLHVKICGQPGTNPAAGSAGGSMGAVVITGSPVTDASTTITAGGTAQNLGTTPANGWYVSNPDAAEDLWVSDTTTAAANATGSIRVASNGGWYESPPGAKITHAVSIVGATTGHKFSAKVW